MNNSELESLLKKAQMPARPEAFLEMFPRQVVNRLDRPPVWNRARWDWFHRWAWALGMAVCVLIAFIFGHWHGQMGKNEAYALLQNEKMLHEVLTLFPNRVRAIVQDDHGLQLVLSDQPDVPASAPLYVHICDGKQCSSLVTFSGQELEVAGQKITVLCDAQGGIILEGNQFVWYNTERNFAQEGLKIEARRLNPITL
jgi:hypothetical protein